MDYIYSGHDVTGPEGSDFLNNEKSTTVYRYSTDGKVPNGDNVSRRNGFLCRETSLGCRFLTSSSLTFPDK